VGTKFWDTLERIIGKKSVAAQRIEKCQINKKDILAETVKEGMEIIEKSPI